MTTMNELRKRANDIRMLTLRSIAHVGKGHLGGAASLCELMSVLYFKQLNVDEKHPDWPDRDRVILSKGHAGPVLYAALALRGYFDPKLLETMNALGTSIPSHCDATRTIGVDVTTGSLGQGFAVSMGIAEGAKLDGKSLHVYPIIGDGESQEGLIWEAAMYAGNHALDNIIAFTDYNKMQIDGLVSEVNDLEPIVDKWKAFKWHVQIINGHQVEEIDCAIDNAKKIKGMPHMIIMNTIKGKGISFAENIVTNHSVTVSKGQFQQAYAALEKVGESL